MEDTYMNKKTIIILIGAVVVVGTLVAGAFILKPNADVSSPETIESTIEPTTIPTEEPTPEPSVEPTPEPETTPEPTEEPTTVPTEEPTPESTKEPTTEQETPTNTEITTRPATEQEKQDAADTRAQEEQALRDMGFTDEQINAYFNGGSGIPIVTPESSSGGGTSDAQGVMERWGLTEEELAELLKHGDGMETH